MKNGDYILVRAPDEYPGTKYRGRYCYEHLLVFWQTHGFLPKNGEIVHHKDGNKHNNSPENLALMKTSEHVSMHKKEQSKNYVELICPGCQKVFVREKRQTHLVKHGNSATCCSRHCAGVFSNLNKSEKDVRLARMVVREFVMNQ